MYYYRFKVTGFGGVDDVVKYPANHIPQEHGDITDRAYIMYCFMAELHALRQPGEYLEFESGKKYPDLSAISIFVELI